MTHPGPYVEQLLQYLSGECQSPHKDTGVPLNAKGMTARVLFAGFARVFVCVCVHAPLCVCVCVCVQETDASSEQLEGLDDAN